MKYLTTITFLLLSAHNSTAIHDGLTSFGRSKLLTKLHGRELGNSKSSKKQDDKAGKSSGSVWTPGTPSGSGGAKSNKGEGGKSNKSSHPALAQLSASSRDNKNMNSNDGSVSDISRLDSDTREVVLKNNLLSAGVVKNYSGAACIGITATMALLWN